MLEWRMTIEERRGSRTSPFGVGRRESHDASPFYNRRLYRSLEVPQPDPAALEKVPVPTPGDWADRLYLQSAEKMDPVPDNSVGMVLTSPPYNASKSYDQDLSLEEYLGLIRRVGAEVYRALRPGGRYLLNVAALGRKPYIPMQAFFWQLHIELGFLPMGEIIWQKAEGANGSCAWGSWMSARSPRLRDLHEYILVMAKQDYSRPDRGDSDIERDAFMEATLSVWKIRPESARRIGHPAPFPLDLARRAIHLYTYTGDVVLDPFIGSGTTAVAAVESGRHYVGFEIEPEYIRLAQTRIQEASPLE
jgi:DNA modification methylase